MLLYRPMHPDDAPDTAAGPSGAGVAPAADPAPAAPKPEPPKEPSLRDRLAASKAQRATQLDELYEAIKAERQQAAQLRAELEAERAAAKSKERESKIKSALARVEIDPDLVDVVMLKFAGLDVEADGWEAKIDEFAKAHPRLVKAARRELPASSWVDGATKALGDRAGRTLLGTMDGDTLSRVLARRP